MARIRTVKPEFWEDETVGLLTRDARLLFLASLNLADDEGLLRWTSAYLKASAFPYDDDLDVADVEVMMEELTESGMVVAYRGGKAQQRLGWIVTFRRHQVINKPTPAKLPAPSLQQPLIARVYARRDRDICHICGDPVVYATRDNSLRPSLDHIMPRSAGGSDYPSNIALAHIGCNARKGAQVLEVPYDESPCATIPLALSGSDYGSDSGRTTGVGEGGKGKERKGREGKGKDLAPKTEKTGQVSQPVWDTLTDLFGQPAPNRRTIYARIGHYLDTQLQDHPDPAGEIRNRAAAIVQTWNGTSRLTLTSLEKHWSRFDGEVGTMTDQDALHIIDQQEWDRIVSAQAPEALEA